MRVVYLLVVASCLTFAACGPPSPGDSCKNDLELTCFSSFSVLECRGGKWTKIPCLGGYGCYKFSSGAAQCDITLTVGDLCPRAANGVGYCRSSDTAVVCKDGMVQEISCSNCPSC